MGSGRRSGQPSDPRSLRRYPAAEEIFCARRLDLTRPRANELSAWSGGRLPPEASSKVAVEKGRRRMKANQIRRAVKRHSQIAGGRRSGGRNNGGPILYRGLQAGHRTEGLCRMAANALIRPLRLIINSPSGLLRPRQHVFNRTQFADGIRKIKNIGDSRDL